ncbi:hypothetical protein CGJ31_24320, partial [Vibrio parahaemolyticus]
MFLNYDDYKLSSKIMHLHSLPHLSLPHYKKDISTTIKIHLFHLNILTKKNEPIVLNPLRFQEQVAHLIFADDE